MKMDIINILTSYANSVSETVQYNWDGDFCKTMVKEATDTLIQRLQDAIDFNKLTEESAKLLGFRKLSSSTTGEIYLIPLYLLPLIPHGAKLVSILGYETVYDGTNIDNDNRAGLLAYGIRINH